MKFNKLYIIYFLFLGTFFILMSCNNSNNEIEEESFTESISTNEESKGEETEITQEVEESTYIEKPVGNPPKITSSPVTIATVGKLYEYQATATGKGIVWSLLESPRGMSIIAESGLVRWFPTKRDVGECKVKIMAKNSDGYDQQSYILTVLSEGTSEEQIPPNITSEPITTAKVGEVYTYKVEATGTPPITWSLTQFPQGMTIDAFGTITWTPQARGNYPVTVTASNPYGKDEQSFEITVTAR